MVSSVGTDQLPFTKNKQCTKRDSDFNLQDGGEILLNGKSKLFQQGDLTQIHFRVFD